MQQLFCAKDALNIRNEYRQRKQLIKTNIPKQKAQAKFTNNSCRTIERRN